MIMASFVYRDGTQANLGRTDKVWGTTYTENLEHGTSSVTVAALATFLAGTVAAGTSIYAVSAGSASTATTAGTADYSTGAGSWLGWNGTATTATTAGTAQTALSFYGTAPAATQAGTATLAERVAGTDVAGTVAAALIAGSANTATTSGSALTSNTAGSAMTANTAGTADNFFGTAPFALVAGTVYGMSAGGIEEAPIDGNIYGRKNGQWVLIFGTTYVWMETDTGEEMLTDGAERMRTVF
jgi:hypothetical protein